MGTINQWNLSHNLAHNSQPINQIQPNMTHCHPYSINSSFIEDLEKVKLHLKYQSNTSMGKGGRTIPPQGEEMQSRVPEQTQSQIREASTPKLVIRVAMSLR